MPKVLIEYCSENLSQTGFGELSMDRKMTLNKYLKETGYKNVNLIELFKTWSTDMFCDKYNI